MGYDQTGRVGNGMGVLIPYCLYTSAISPLRCGCFDRSDEMEFAEYLRFTFLVHPFPPHPIPSLVGREVCHH